MRKNSIVLKLAMLVAAVAVSTFVPSMTSEAAEAYQTEFTSLINAKRAANGLAPVELQDSALSKAANTRADELTQKFSYERPDGRRESTVLYDNGVNDEFVGECYSAGQESAKEAFANMMQYNFFEKEVLRADAKYVGVGHHSGGEYENYWDVLLTAPETTSIDNSYAQQVVDLVNAERAKNGLSPVVLGDEKLNAAAQKRAVEIATTQSHTRPDGSSCFTVLDEFGVADEATGENAAWGQATPQEVVADWMNSEGHRANILNPNARKMGVGYYSDSSTEWGRQWIQIFTE